MSRDDGTASGGAGGRVTAADVTRLSRQKSLLVTQFIAHVKKLVADMVATFPTDPIVDRIKNKVTAGAEINPEKVVTLVGEALYSFEEHLTTRNEDYFLENEFDGISREARNEQHKKDGLHLAAKVKAMYKSLPLGRRAEYMDRLNEMLDIFLEAVQLTRKIGG